MERPLVWGGVLHRLKLQLSLREYRRQFVQPLHTAHGPWQERRGLILRLQTSSGQSSYGEIAPIPWFGTETLEEAIAILRPFQNQPTYIEELTKLLASSPNHYSATHFGLGMAMAQLQGKFPPPAPSPAPEQICALLPAGAAALEAWQKLWNRGHRTFKWKLGIGDIEQELQSLVELRRSLPRPAKLRLDANGGLDIYAAHQCLAACDELHREGIPIEFLEQPLPPKQFNDLMALSQAHTTALALDESVTGLFQLKDCHGKGWRGIFVVKGAIAGSPLEVIQFCRHHQLKVVFSSVFETGLACQAVLAMAQQVYKRPLGTDSMSPGASAKTRMGPKTIDPQSSQYALGFGVSHWLRPDGLETQAHFSNLNLRGQALWQQLSNC